MYEEGPDGSGGEENQPSRSMTIGRWSELSVTSGSHLALIPKWGLVMVRSGEDDGPDRGRLVWEGPLMHISWPASSALPIYSPLLAAAASCVWEYHLASWALKSPMTTTSLVISKSGSKLGSWPCAEEAGGI